MVTPGSQQQFFFRNFDSASDNGGVWNMVYVGCTGAPSWNCGNSNGAIPVTTVSSTPVIAEKPYLVLDGTQYSIMKPKLEYYKVGTTPGWENAD